MTTTASFALLLAESQMAAQETLEEMSEDEMNDLFERSEPKRLQ